MLNAFEIFQAVIASPQRTSGLRRLAASLRVNIEGLSRFDAAKAVATACRVDSNEGRHEAMAAAEERRILERDAARLRALSEATEATQWSKTG